MNELMQQQTMTSLIIAEVVGKPHNEVLKVIRAMEPAWEKVGAGKFSLSSYTSKQNKQIPMYKLNKAEFLYIATKFNDEARARLVLRWEELENEARQRWMEEQKLPKAQDGVLGGLSPNTMVKALELCVRNQTAIQDLYHKFDYCVELVENCSRRIERVGGGKEAPYVEKLRELANIDTAEDEQVEEAAQTQPHHTYQPVCQEPNPEPEHFDEYEGLRLPTTFKTVAKHAGISPMLLCQWLVHKGYARLEGRTFLLKSKLVQKQYLIRKNDRYPYVRDKDLSVTRYLWTRPGVKFLLKMADMYLQIPRLAYQDKEISPSYKRTQQ